MCTSVFQSFMARVNESHLGQMRHLVPDETFEIVAEIFEEVDECISTPIPFITTIAVAVDACRKGFSGVLGDDLVCIPFTTCDVYGARYRTPLMEILHETFLTARMSELAMDALRRVLHKYDMDVCFLCCCGTVVGTREAIGAFYGSALHHTWDGLRSLYNSEPTPLESIDSFEELEGVQTIDLRGAERGLFREIDRMLTALAQNSQPTHLDHSLLTDRVNLLLARAEAA